MQETFTKVVLYTDAGGRSKFREEQIPLLEAGPIGRLSDVLKANAYQLRRSPVGYQGDFHCSSIGQWVFILGGEMEIELVDGTKRVFLPGQSFYSADFLPTGHTFTPGLHGHRTRQRGEEALVTLFLRDER